MAAAACNVLGTPLTFAANLGNFENPPTGSPGTGFALVTIDTTAHLLTVDFNFSGLQSTTTAAHIHCCLPPPSNSGVATQTPRFVGFPTGVTSGSYFHVFDSSDLATYNPAFVTANGGTAAGAEAALLAGLLAGNAYLNIHTTVWPGGEIRGFLTQTPEPATMMLTGAALAAVMALRRWRNGNGS
jgi:hypothetical protein